ncbi:uncharacterized protein CIMG_10229 [Coccidioides immitis RS]|uniref:Uncharacterized protein n=1 Tax=Coccidioides immitis (strain RS) TaxID=246410 RepID=J3K127_COCIM|nr:uncharacterized protein CIMG_10229 [Coccidioides immitis RS]EAS27624.3 hypothetical protein CIMG_10229 [Coccidioides immitis RS]
MRGRVQKSTNDPVPNFFTLNNGYPNAVHSLVGAKDSSGHFTPIYIDTEQIESTFSVSYEPVEMAQWWYQYRINTATMVENVVSKKETQDFSADDRNQDKSFKWQSTYKVNLGKWESNPIMNQFQEFLLIFFSSTP